MRRGVPAALLALTAWLAASGCVYVRTTEPLDVNFDRTPVQTGRSDSSIKRFTYQIVDVQWSSNAIGDIARRNGIERVYYADLETLRVLGVWGQRWVHVYGE